MYNIEIKYDGEYPNLCSGHLEVWVDGQYYDFGDYCLHSGGYVAFDDEWNEEVGEGGWVISFPDNFPEEYKSAVYDKVNEEIPHGCCGGCV